MIRSSMAGIASRPRLAALLGAFCISFSGILYLYAEVTSETATVFRALYGLPLLFAAAWFERRRLGPLPRRARRLAALAGVFFAADLLFWHYAIDAVGAGLATVLGNLQVVIVAVVAWLLFAERPAARTLLSIPIILAGVVLISGVIGAGAYGADPPLGVLLGVLTAIAYAGYLILIRQAGRGRPAEPVAIATTFTAIVGIAVGLALGRLDLVPSWPAHGWLLLLGVTSQSLGYLLISLSLPRLPAVATSIILLAQPVMAVVWAMALIGEAPSLAQLGGVGLVIGGIALATAPLRGLSRRALPAAP